MAVARSHHGTTRSFLYPAGQADAVVAESGGRRDDGAQAADGEQGQIVTPLGAVVWRDQYATGTRTGVLRTRQHQC